MIRVVRIAALVVVVAALWHWPRPAPGYGWTFWAWIAGGAAFWATLPRGVKPSPAGESSAFARVALAAILVFAAGVRLWAIESVPENVAIDELLPGLEALRIAQGLAPNVFSSVGWFTIPNLSFAIPGVFLWLLPDDAFLALRLSSVVTGLAGIVGTFLLARRFFGSAVALTAAFLMAAGFWHIHNSRTGFPFVQTSFAVPWVLYLLVRARQERSAMAMFGAGVALGLALQLYFPVRILLVLVPLFVVVGWVGRGDSWRTRLGDSLRLGGGALFALAPLLTSVSPDALLGRSQGVLLTRPAVFAELSRIYRVESVPAVVWRNFQESYGMFREWADVCILNRSPDGLFDALTFAAIVLGVLIALFQARGYALLFVAWVAAVFFLGVALSDAPRASYRLSPAMPAFYILAAYGFHATFLPVRAGPRWYRLTVVPCLLAVFVTSIVLENIDSFFVDYARRGDGRPMPPSAAMRFAGERCDGREIYFLAHPEPLGSDAMIEVFCARHRAIRVEEVPAVVNEELAATFIVVAHQRGSLERLRACYPGAAVEDHRAPDGRFLFTSVDVERPDLARATERCPPVVRDPGPADTRLRRMLRDARPVPDAREPARPVKPARPPA